MFSQVPREGLGKQGLSCCCLWVDWFTSIGSTEPHSQPRVTCSSTSGLCFSSHCRFSMLFTWLCVLVPPIIKPNIPSTLPHLPDLDPWATWGFGNLLSNAPVQWGHGGEGFYISTKQIHIVTHACHRKTRNVHHSASLWPHEQDFSKEYIKRFYI
jgi:hypothetical protein